MQNTMIFENNQVEVFELNGQVLFNPYDVGRCLGISESTTRDNISLMNEKQVIKLKNSNVDSIDFRKLHNTGENFLTESGVYKLIFKSRKPNAEKFQDWVTNEVLPSIRKNGGYILNQENLTQEEILAKALIVAQNVINEKDKLNKELQATNSQLVVDNSIMKPKADYFDELVERNLLTNLTDTAKMLGIQRKVFIDFLLDNKYLYRGKGGALKPYSNKNNGIFEIKESLNEKTNWSGIQTLVTPKGREVFRLLLITKSA